MEILAGRPLVHRLPLPTWMGLTRNPKQTLDRDMVFGLLSLSSARGQLGIKPDYRIPDDLVFRRLFIHLTKVYGLNAIRFKPSIQLDFSLPSWCGPWSSSNPKGAVLRFLGGGGVEMFNACGGTQMSSRFTSFASPPMGQVNVPGLKGPVYR